MFVPAYCTNVHPGATLGAMRSALAEHSIAVRRLLVRDGTLEAERLLPLGAWLAAPVARALVAGESGGLPALRAWLDEHRLAVTTLNGFPFDDFHTRRVKHTVYRPDWTTPQRSAYTTDLVECAAALHRTETPSAARRALSISTLPLGWPAGPFADPNPISALAESARRITDVVEHARRTLDSTGCHVRLDLEPEPGCVLQRAADVAGFTEKVLRPEARRRGLSDETLAAHLGVCLDVCHLAVMFEAPEDFVACVRGAGLTIGKVQISSAPRVDFERAAAGGAIGALRSMAEERYLHQTMVRLPDGTLRFSEDLPAALAWIGPGRPPEGEWRVHYHVPIFLERIEVMDSAARVDGGAAALATTRDLIAPALAAAALDDPVIEVETYAWSVLPAAARRATLAEGIAEELRSAAALVAQAKELRRERGDHD